MKELKTMKREQGFTLVEIAIVLVIIGLLLGAVFKGQELINQAKVKNATKQFDEVRAAYYTYLDKKNGVPGDTDNDGIINSNNDFWQALHDENLISGSGTTALNNPYGVAMATAGSSANYICSKVPETAAVQIDTKVDDGVGSTGSYIKASADPADATDPTAADYSASGATADLVWLCSKL